MNTTRMSTTVCVFTLLWECQVRKNIHCPTEITEKDVPWRNPKCRPPRWHLRRGGGPRFRPQGRWLGSRRLDPLTSLAVAPLGWILPLEETSWIPLPLIITYCIPGLCSLGTKRKCFCNRKQKHAFIRHIQVPCCGLLSYNCVHKGPNWWYSNQGLEDNNTAGSHPFLLNRDWLRPWTPRSAQLRTGISQEKKWKSRPWGLDLNTHAVSNRHTEWQPKTGGLVQ